MKKLLISFAFLISFVASKAQTYVPTGTGYGNLFNAIKVPFAFAGPSGLDTTFSGRPKFNGSIFFQTSDKRYYIFDSTTNSWKGLAWLTDVNSLTGLVNVGTGYRLTFPFTHNVRTLFAGYGTKIDSTLNSNGLTLLVDTSLVIPYTDTLKAFGIITTTKLNNALSSFISNLWVSPIDSGGVNSPKALTITGNLVRGQYANYVHPGWESDTSYARNDSLYKGFYKDFIQVINPTGVSDSLGFVAGADSLGLYGLIASTNITITPDRTNHTYTFSAATASPGGSSGQFQYNTGSAFGGASGLTYSGTTVTASGVVNLTGNTYAITPTSVVTIDSTNGYKLSHTAAEYIDTTGFFNLHGSPAISNFLTKGFRLLTPSDTANMYGAVSLKTLRTAGSGDSLLMGGAGGTIAKAAIGTNLSLSGGILSATGGGGSVNTSVGAGFRWVVWGTNNVKSYTNGIGLLTDSATANQLNTKLDTTYAVTKATGQVISGNKLYSGTSQFNGAASIPGSVYNPNALTVATVDTTNGQLLGHISAQKVDTTNSYKQLNEAPIYNITNKDFTMIPVGTIVASADDSAKTSAIGSIWTYTVPPGSHSYEISAYLNVTAISGATVLVAVFYTDIHGTSQSVQLGSTISTISAPPQNSMEIRAKGGTTISIATSESGTSITYDAGGTLTFLR